MNETFVVIEIENADAATTEKIVYALMTSKLGYDHITGKPGMLIGATTIEFAIFKDRAEDLIHNYNNGMYVDVQQVSRESVEHLF